MLCGLLACLLLASPCSPAGRAIVTEVVYDALGDDTGHEFVELFNPTGRTVALAGVRLESGDGAGAGRWTLRWTGGPADSLAPGARFLIGGSLVVPAPDALVALNLQNGPDAVRLAWPDGAIEVVGYGALALPEYFCGAPAADVESGLALARIPDAADLGSNAADFRAAPPTPGRPNQARRNLALVRGSIALDPASPAPGEPVRAGARLTNAGADTIRVGDIAVTAEIEEVEETPGAAGARHARPAGRASLAAARPQSPAAARPASPAATSPPTLGPLDVLPGDTLAFDLDLGSLAAGKHRVWIAALVAGDEQPADDRDSLRFRVGAGPVEITEIQFHPAEGEGEWVELRNRSSRPLEVGALTLSDRGAGRAVPRDGAGALPPDSLALLAQDRAALLATYPALDPARVWQAAPWPALNNSDDSLGIADYVVIREADGLVADRVAYHAGGVPAGVPLERRAGEWLPALDPRGTPLAPPRAPPPAARRFDVSPARIPAGDARLTLAWALPWPRADVRADLYDLDGRRVATLLPERGAPGRATRELTLGVAPAGVYQVVLEARATGGDRLVESRPIRIVGRAR